jgi:chemotaxis signal transduction protein
MMGYLLVRAGGNKYGLRLDQVVEVADGFDVSPAPKVHPAVRGLIRMREKSVPLVHLASLVNNKAVPDKYEGTAVLTRCHGTWAAFEVEDAEAVASDEPAEVPDAWQLPWVYGVVRRDGSLVPVIDVDVLGERLVAGGKRESP